MKLMMVSGELSGDIHGGSILRHLNKLIPGLEVFGVGGAQMIAEGLRSVLPIADLQARGLVEVLRHIPRHIAYLRLLDSLLERERPDAVLLIDYPGFNLKVAKAAKTRGIPVLYYCGPQLWAWRAGRMREVARWVDKLIVLFPFEIPLYRSAGVDAEFLGHPLVGISAGEEEVAALRREAALQEGLPVVAIMPGSRPSELHRHLPRLLEAVRKIGETGYRANYVLPVAATLDTRQIRETVRESGTDVRVVEDGFLPLLKIADLAIVASGTATLQVGMAGVPFIVVYRVSWLTYHLARRFMRVKDISIVNILAGRKIVPELLQENFTAEHVRDVFLIIAKDTTQQQRMRQALAEVTAQLGEPGAYARTAEIFAGKLRGKDERDHPATEAGAG